MSGSRFTRSLVNALVAGVLGQATVIIKTELTRAKEELIRKLRNLGIGIGLVVFAASLLGFGLVLLFIAGLIALTNIWPAWLVALAGGGVAILIGLIFLAVGSSKIKRNKDLKPDLAIQNIKSLFGAYTP